MLHTPRCNFSFIDGFQDGDYQHGDGDTDDNANDNDEEDDDGDNDDEDGDGKEEVHNVEPGLGKSCHRDIDECELDEHDAVHHLGRDDVTMMPMTTMMRMMRRVMMISTSTR